MTAPTRSPAAHAYVNIEAILNQAGLTRSAHLLAGALRDAGCRVTINTRHPSLFARGVHQVWKRRRRHPYDVNIFLEHVDPHSLNLAPINLLVPNQEWLREDTVPYLQVIDGTLCKTRHAEAIFAGRSRRAVFTSFTTADRLCAGIPPDYRRFFHLAGTSLQKGTEALLTVWLRHPEWPALTVVQHPRHQRHVRALNIAYMPEHLADGQLRTLQNRHGVHVCPSEAEGFGHSIVEAMSCCALVITTDAPPMNELITKERGLLVPWADRVPQRLGMAYFVDAEALEQAIATAIAMDDEEKRAIGCRARAWFDANDLFFRRTIGAIVAGWPC